MLVVIGLLPIPGPFDEALLVVIAPLVLLFGRRAMREALGDAPARARVRRFTLSAALATV